MSIAMGVSLIRIPIYAVAASHKQYYSTSLPKENYVVVIMRVHTFPMYS